jgi:rod shape-determining protein MreC
MFESRFFHRPWDAQCHSGERRVLTRRLTLALLVLSIVLTAYTRDHDELGSSGSTLVGEVLAPLSRWINISWSPLKTFLQDYVVLVDVQRENRQLKQRVAALKTRVNELEEQRRENHRLRGLLGAAPESSRSKVVAKVISYDRANRVFGVTIDKGANEGLAVRDAVVNGAGVVGIVSAVMSNSAKVLLLNDARSGVDVRTSESRSRGVVRGYGASGLTIEYLPVTKKVEVGEKVLTSGLDRVFPPGLLVGKVERVSSSSQTLFRRVVVEPAVDFDRLEEVLVIGGAAE